MPSPTDRNRPSAEGSTDQSSTLLSRLSTAASRLMVTPNQVLEAFAQDCGGSFTGGSPSLLSPKDAQVVLQEGECCYIMKTGAEVVGRHPVSATTLNIKFPALQALNFQLAPDGAVKKLFEGLFRVEDIFPGPTGFDKKFTVQASDKDQAREVFSGQYLQDLLVRLEGISIKCAAERDEQAQIVLRLPYQAGSPQVLSELLSAGRELIRALEGLAVAPGPGNDLASPEEILSFHLKALEYSDPALFSSKRMSQPIAASLAWALRKETQVCHETIQNAEDSAAIAMMKQRLEMNQVWEVRSSVRDNLIEPLQDGQAWMKFSSEIVLDAMQKLRAELGDYISQEQRDAIENQLSQLVAEEFSVCNNLVLRAPEVERRDALSNRTSPEIVVRDLRGNFLESRVHTARWGEWYPGLNNDHSTLAEVHKTLPGFPPSHVPAIVRLYENPESRFALPGAVTLEQHDYIHILLGRGLLDQDEAFVVGFTMGSCSERLQASDVDAMEHAFEALYPEPYRITGIRLAAFRLGVEAGQKLALEDLSKFDFSSFASLPLGELRAKTLRSVPGLRDCYQQEAQRIPGSLETARLPKI